MTLWIVYYIGVLLHLFLQMQNSIRSSSNGLTDDWAGMKKWLKLQSIGLLVRLFLATMIFPVALAGPLSKTVTGALASAGFPLPPWAMAGIAGYNLDSLLNQLFGLFPWMRKEIPQLVPPDPLADPPKAQ